MSKVIYTNESQVPLAERISPVAIWRNIARHKEVLFAFVRRDFHATHRGTYLGLAWTVVSPLIMLAVFTLVFGYIFRGRFNLVIEESPLDYALALFVGLAFFNLISAALGGSPSLMASNSTYVKSVAFPLEIIPIAAILNMMIGLGISLGLCIVAYVVLHGTLHLSMIGLVPLIAATFLLALGIAWLFAALGVFVKDLSSIVPPISLVLMFVSSVFFPIGVLPEALRPLVRINPLATIIDEARASLLWGHWIDPWLTLAVLVGCLIVAVLGYAFFVRTKHAFADVL